MNSTNLEVPLDGSTQQPLEAPNIQESTPNEKCGPLMLPPLLDEMLYITLGPGFVKTLLLLCCVI
jgi:hypothetical protein